jgi:hypothetical protein
MLSSFTCVAVPGYMQHHMGEVVTLKQKSPKQRARGKTLCRRGFHKWAVDKQTRFDVREGKLVTRKRCERCGIERVELR